jgi:hypothetical protein
MVGTDTLRLLRITEEISCNIWERARVMRNIKHHLADGEKKQKEWFWLSRTEIGSYWAIGAGPSWSVWSLLGRSISARHDYTLSLWIPWWWHSKYWTACSTSWQKSFGCPWHACPSYGRFLFLFILPMFPILLILLIVQVQQLLQTLQISPGNRLEWEV